MTDLPALLRALVDGGVSFIIVGGAAATAHGSSRLTQDLDLVYERSRENIARLAHALAPHGLCLDLDTLIEVKRAAGRPNDLEAIAELEAIREERGR